MTGNAIVVNPCCSAHRALRQFSRFDSSNYHPSVQIGKCDGRVHHINSPHKKLPDSPLTLSGSYWSTCAASIIIFGNQIDSEWNNMPIGDLILYAFLLIAAKTFNVLETSVATVRALIGAIETSVPDEVMSVPGKKGRNVTVHVYLNEAAKRAKTEHRPCVTYITLHGTTTISSILRILTSLQVAGSFSKGMVVMPLLSITSYGPPLSNRSPSSSSIQTTHMHPNIPSLLLLRILPP
jgi:hypothetical protein